VTGDGRVRTEIGQKRIPLGSICCRDLGDEIGMDLAEPLLHFRAGARRIKGNWTQIIFYEFAEACASCLGYMEERYLCHDGSCHRLWAVASWDYAWNIV
jgi:hypothetical protein